MALGVLKRRRAAKVSPDEMTLVQHLGELRKRLTISVVALFVGASVAFFFYSRILSFFVSPYCHVVGPHHSCALYVTGPLDGFSIRLKLAVYCGAFLASPVILWQIWRFITPGLKRNEKRYAVPFICSSILLFAGGSAVAYTVFPHALHWLSAVGGPDLKQIYTPNSYLNLIVLLMVAFGVAFEFPVVLVSLEFAGIVKPEQLIKHWRIAVVAVFAVAAVFIPSSDPFSLFAMAIPMCVFYFGSALIGKLAGK
ncbi:MAG TPA: twin-arginine translocase subunit TatC [Acidimicrobiales bacterium]|nr:twin-arginine translocase subunit TatC [Acidimicrobiales bacterium]